MSVVALSMRDKVNRSSKMKCCKHKQVEIPIRHYFSPGVYAREITDTGWDIIDRPSSQVRATEYPFRRRDFGTD